MKIHTPLHHQKILLNEENKSKIQGKRGILILQNQNVVAWQVTRVQHRNLFQLVPHITNPQTLQNVAVQDITQTKIHKRVMVEIPPPVPYIATKHVLYQYNCKNCTDSFKTDGNLPPHGCFDSSAIREVASLFSKRMPYDTIR